MATWAATPSTNLGLVLAAPDEGDSFAWKKFSSFETGAPPALHVVWSEPAATAPGPPQSAAAYPSNQSALITWTAPASNGGAPILGYGVWAWTYPGFVAVSFTEACATCTYVGIGGLTNGQQYYFGVYARNAVGWGAGAGTNLATPGPVAPSAPPSAIRGGGQPIGRGLMGTLDKQWRCGHRRVRRVRLHLSRQRPGQHNPGVRHMYHGDGHRPRQRPAVRLPRLHPQQRPTSGSGVRRAPSPTP